MDSVREGWQRPGSYPGYASSHSCSEQGVTELDAPPPLRGARTHGSLEERQESLRRSFSSAHNDHRLSLSELAAPPPVDERKALPDEERGYGNQEDLETRRRSEKGEPLSEEEHPTTLDDLYTVSWLIFFSFWGTLARLGIETITLYPDSPFFSRVLWANLGGSFVMGFLVEDRRLFRHEWGTPNPDASASAHLRVKKTIPLYIGLSTGFCGCFTSFSSFMRDAFLAMSNNLEGPSDTSPYHVDTTIHHRNGGFSFLALLAVLIAHSAISLSALSAGANFALLLQPITPSLPFTLLRRVLDPLGVVLGFGGWLAAVFLTLWPPGDTTHWRYRATMPLLFSPPGCLLRFYASKYLNVYIPWFPLGTFSVNMVGTAVLGMAWDLQHAVGIGAGVGVANGCAVLEGITEGFCGCLTTVSTWVLELDGLNRRHAWIYGLSSVGAGFGLLVVIMGSMAWTVGFSEPGCS
ncbi:hypothetical protein DV736_g4081, partial [Chaetothyriales sp. CBS 134916]